MAHKLSTSYLEDSLSLFRYYKKLGEGAMDQVSDDQLFATLDPEMNSIAIITKHIAGNMRSRWTDFLTSDDSVMQAINRQIAHYSSHIGQIVFLAKHLNASGWKSLSVPRNKSAEFDRKVQAGEASQR